VTFIDGLYGDIAVVVICGVFFVNEAGVPMPLNCELVLIASGILIGTGGLDPWLFVPVAMVAAAGGAFTGYSWARLVGEHGLQRVAAKLRLGPHLARLSGQLGRASSLRIALWRLTPGFRVYTSLVAGAVGVPRRRFLTGVLPVIVAWVVVYTALGALVGVPASHFLNHLQTLALQGGLLIAIGVGAYIVVRRVPLAGRAVLGRVPYRLRVALAVAVDVALIATVMFGVMAIIRGLLAFAYPVLPVEDFAWWVELLAVVAVIAAFYSVATRRGLEATAGERLLAAGYLTRRGVDPLARLSPAGPDEEAAPPAEVVRMAEGFRALADPRRLQVARVLLQRDASAATVSSTLGLPAAQASDALGELEEAGLVTGDGDGSDRRYRIADNHVRLGLAELLAHMLASTTSAET